MTKKIKLNCKNNKLYFKFLIWNQLLTESHYSRVNYIDGKMVFRGKYPIRGRYPKEYYYECSQDEANTILKEMGYFCLNNINPSTGENTLRLFKNKLDKNDLYGQSFLGTQEKLLKLTDFNNFSVIKDPVVAYDKIDKFLQEGSLEDQSLWLISINNPENFFNGKSDPMFGRPAFLGVCYFYNKVEKLVPHNSLLDITNIIDPIEFIKLSTHIYA